MEVSGATAVGRLTDLARAQARAEAESWSAMLEFREAEHARTEAVESPMLRLVERSAIALEIGQAMGLSEGQVVHRLAAAQRVRDSAPHVWVAFSRGRIDGARVREISLTIEKLQRPASVMRLDQRVVAYAESHTTAELRAWLRRFVMRVEGDLAVPRAEAARSSRKVDIVHTDDGMAWLNAHLPSHMAAAIDKRLTKEARTFGADDDRSIPQRRAGLLASWATSNEAGEPALHADIAVTITADVLAGATEGFAVSADGSWGVPARWVTDLARSGDPFWHRIVVEPVTHDVLAHDHVGRFAPDVLAKALQFRDGVCQAPGCLTPADRCDLDHREPWPDGRTSGDNMWALCRRHHSMKGHQVLRWSTTHGHRSRPEPAHHGPPTGSVSGSEQHLARFMADAVVV
ncbi:HNH endonuclease domain protein [Aeromicrobium marinum DSM 15272]|uniref:HNH endonuclease domain protein n=1 Tax=Aeromicrobium marinum DSM 15272 TaxID=585531 RepID=E2SE64_9ACTN|nr:HNH endonuclease signature motif containing protein [Aeromicrobium marinum]EFQ82791.1 HNH endonuclease domain protein [Aeromicrobium marinum DSM 15272]